MPEHHCSGILKKDHSFMTSSTLRCFNMDSIFFCPKFIFPLRNRDIELSETPMCSARSLLFTLRILIASFIVSLIIPMTDNIHHRQ